MAQPTDDLGGKLLQRYIAGVMSVRISIITATYNAQDTIADCLRSMAGQRHRDWEHIVVDGASTDGTLDVLRSHAAQIATLISEPDGGMYEAINKGIACATGEVIGLLHADDIYADDQVLEDVAKAFASPDVSAVYGDLQYVSKGDGLRVIRHWRAGRFGQQKLLRGWMPPHPSLFLRRHVYERCGGFSLQYRIAADYDFMLRALLSLDGRVVALPKVLVKMRLGGASNKSLSAVARKSAEDYRILRSHGLGRLAAGRALTWKNLSKLGQFLV